MNDMIAKSAQPDTSQGLLSTFLFDPGRMNALQSFAEMMSKGVIAIPQHFRGKPADCMAIVLQSMQWRMNPYAVAQKTYMDPSGKLSYESQLIYSVLMASGALKTRPEAEYLGDWTKIMGRIEEKTGSNGGKYYVAAWKKEDEAGLGIIISAMLSGETSPRSVQVMMTQAYPRFSTQWATDPQQQLFYLATRKFGRRYAPDAILGLFTPDEIAAGVDAETFDVIEDEPAQSRGPRRKTEKDIPMIDEVQRQSTSPPSTAHVDPETGEISQPAAAAAAAAVAAPSETRQSQAQPHVGGETAKVEQITPNQIKYLRNKLNATGLAEDGICKRFNVASIELLSADQFDKLKTELLQNA